MSLYTPTTKREYHFSLQTTTIQPYKLKKKKFKKIIVSDKKFAAQVREADVSGKGRDRNGLQWSLH